jgi:1-acyl-sn-glycerol-3-phosphate acyltransferase
MSLYKSRHPAAYLIPEPFTWYVRTYTRLKVEGLDTFPKEGPVLIAANHSSHADTAVIFTSLPKSVRSRFVAAAARDYFFKGDALTTISRVLFNVIPVARERTRGEDPLRHISRALREGYVVLFFPEGTRSKDGRMGPFRSGIGRLIAEFPGLPVLPTYISGTTRVMPKGKLIPRPAKVIVRFGVPLFLSADPKQRRSWQEAADELREHVVALSAGKEESLVVQESEGRSQESE